ncbi:MAG: NAD(P)-binding protein, partial [Pseudomonadales bacterium]
MFDIAIIGAGPGGLSAAARCAELELSHVLLESSPRIASTIQKYQKGKHVMAEPGLLPLRSSIGFKADKREGILETWEAGVSALGVNIRYGAEVKGIEGDQGAFSIVLMGGDRIPAANL